MRKFLKISMVIVPIALISWGFLLKQNDTGEEVLLKVIKENLDYMHFAPLEMNDALSEKAFDKYLDFIDGNKRFLLASDIKQLEVDRLKIDDQTIAGSYVFFDNSLVLLNNRIEECQDYYRGILETPFVFTENETVEFGEDLPYAANQAEMKERWRKYLKYNVMTRVATALSIENAKKADSTNTDEIKSFEMIEKDTRAAVLKNHNDWFERLKKLDRRERLTTYVNAITTLYDPHTTYFPPADKENFDIRMSGQLQGIGAQLQEKDGYIRVTSIVPGSPSALQGELKANDLILKVAQGDGEAVDIVNARIDDAVKLIRGDKGTEVRLTVKKPDGTVKIIPIVRDIVMLEETYAKSVMLHDESNKKVGYLYLPSFYADFSGEGGPSSSKDVKKELKKLMKDGAKSLIFDLRNNGGGSLQDVVEIVGFFIDKGPVVQVKARNYPPRILEDEAGGILWDKPVVIMVNEFSASASEILAAAIQDYGRGIIVGSHTTHGKGSVQQFFDLNRTLRGTGYPDLGALKITTQKFYRIDGSTTQLKGVTPDIIWPDNYTYIPTGEKEQDNSLEWDKIEPTTYTVNSTSASHFTDIISSSTKRIKENPVFIEIDKNAVRWKAQRDKHIFTLNLAAYQAETAAKKVIADEYAKLFKPFDALKIETLKDDKKVLKADSTKAVRAKSWHNALRKDIYLYETIQIAEELG
ncbi:MAG: carboxyl-terminal processing protease [Bacteroidia bacterium]|jgi:carboxyl-terminal processing protease